jgi:hypothetical protein
VSEQGNGTNKDAKASPTSSNLASGTLLDVPAMEKMVIAVKTAAVTASYAVMPMPGSIVRVGTRQRPLILNFNKFTFEKHTRGGD